MKEIKNNINFMPAVESMSRKFVPRKETCGNKTIGKKILKGNGWIGSAVRQGFAAGYGPYSKNYVVIRKHARSSALSTDEMQAQSRFSATAKILHYQRRDLAQQSVLRDMWLEAKEDITKTVKGVSAAGYSWLGWIFAVDYKRLADGEEQSAVRTFPTEFDS